MESKNQEFFVPRSSRSLEHQLIAETKNAFDRDVIDVDTATAMHGTPQQSVIYDEKHETELKDYLYNGLNDENVQIPPELIQIIMSYFPYVVKGKLVKTLAATKSNSESSSICGCIQLSDNQLAVGYENGFIKIWDLTTGECIKTLLSHPGPICCFLKLTNGQLAYAGSGMEHIKIWDPNTDTHIQSLNGPLGRRVWCLIQLTNNQLVSGSDDNIIEIWDLNTGTCTKTLRGDRTDAAIKYLIQLANRQIASVSTDNIIKIWNLANGECLKTLTKQEYMAECPIQLANGIIAAASDENTIELWDQTTGECVKTLTGHKNSATCLLQLTNGQLASGSWDKTIKIWDLTKPERNECIKTLQGSKSCIKCLLLLANGALASGSDGNTIRIWDPTTGECLKTFNRTFFDSAICLMQLANGKLVSVSSDGIKIWN
jgi:WD40 repeat protein